MSELYQPTLDELLNAPGDWLFTDGGLLSPNPSYVGGTWAWCRVKDGEMVDHASGIILPENIALPAVTNNLSELMAMWRGIVALPEGWRGTIASDSHVTLCRRFPAAKYTDVPPLLEEFARCAFDRVRDTCNWVLLSGHASRAALAAGKGKGGLPVSRFNNWVDDECNRVKAEFRARGEKEK